MLARSAFSRTLLSICTFAEYKIEPISYQKEESCLGEDFSSARFLANLEISEKSKNICLKTACRYFILDQR